MKRFETYFTGLIFQDLVHFCPFFRFSSFFGPDFSFFHFFSIFRYGILARRSRPCVVAHPETIVKRANWAPEVTGFKRFVQLVDLDQKHCACLTKTPLEYSPQLLIPNHGTHLTDPTHCTRRTHSNPEGVRPRLSLEGFRDFQGPLLTGRTMHEVLLTFKRVSLYR
jgi:hypothetical protein